MKCQSIRHLSETVGSVGMVWYAIGPSLSETVGSVGRLVGWLVGMVLGLVWVRMLGWLVGMVLDLA